VLTHLELSPDSRLAVATFVEGSALVWQVDSGELRHRLTLGNSQPDHATFSPDGRWLAVASADGLIRRFEADTGRELSPPLNHGGVLRRLAFSPDSRRLASGGSEPPVKLWDWERASLAGSLPHDREVVRVAFNPAGTRLLTAMSDETTDGLSAQVWDLGTFQPVGQRMEHAHGVAHADFFPDGSRVLTTSEESEARIWNATDGSPRTPWIRCGRRILRTEVSPDGLTVATVDEGGTLRLWDTDTGELLSASAPGDWAYHAAFIGSDRVVWAGRGGPLRLLQLPVAAGPVDDLSDLARLSAGQELDATGGRAPLPAAAQLELFARLRATTPDRFAVRLSAPEWHRQEMARAATETNAFAEEFHRRALARPGR
jgi:WD40 repeat protein